MMMVEQGYGPGALGVAAIDRGDWATAEAKLTSGYGARDDDPARLINLGRVYMETGRTEEALAAWRLALASTRHFEAETGSGRYASTRDIARDLLTRHGARVQSAALTR